MALENAHSVSRWITGARLLVLLSYFALLFISYSLYKTGLTIETDLKDLSPALAEEPLLAQTLNEITGAAEKKIRLMLFSEDEFELEDATVDFEERLSSYSHIFLNHDNEDALQAYINLLKATPYNFLTPEDREKLNRQSENTILSDAKNNLYRFSAGPRLFSLGEDPIGNVDRFVWQLIHRLSGQHAGENALNIEEKSYFYTVTDIEINLSALSMSDQEKYIYILDTLLAEVTHQHPEVSVLRSGIAFFAHEAAQKSKKDIGTIVSGSLLGTVLLLWLVFRSFRPLLLPMISMLSGIFSATLFCAWIFDGIHILTILFGASLIGVVVDYSLHFAYFQAHNRGEKTDASVYRALTLSFLTSILGYGALSMAGLTALKQVAVFSIVGLLCAWLMVMAIGSLVIRSGSPLSDRYLFQFVGYTLAFLGRYARRIYFFLCAVFVLILAILTIVGLKYSDEPRDFFQFTQERLREESLVNEQISDFEPGRFILVRANTEDEIYRTIREVRNLLDDAQGGSRTLLGVDDFIPSREDQAKNQKANTGVYKAGIGARFLAEIKVSQSENATLESLASLPWELTPPSHLFSTGVSNIPRLWAQSGKSTLAILFIEKGIDTDRLSKVLHTVENAEYFSAIEETQQSLKQLREAAQGLLLGAGGLIIVLLLVRYRHWSSSGLILVPAAAILLTLSVLHIAAVGVNLFHIMAMFLVFGLGMDYVIFVYEVRESVRHTVSAIVLSACTSLLAFGLLSLSSVPVVQSFGISVLLGNSFNLVGSFLLAAYISSRTTGTEKQWP